MFTSSTKLFQGITPASGATAYQISRSLRFNSADSASLTRTPAGAGDTLKWTWSGWIKKSANGATGTTGECKFFGAASTASNFVYLMFSDNTTDALTFAYFNGTSHVFRLTTSAVYRDLSAWYHIVLAYDSAQATDTNRIKLYINGVQVTSFGTAVYPTQNYASFINGTNTHYLGQASSAAGGFFNGYMSDVNFVDGQALDPTSFGQTDSATGVWSPIAYTGTYGTNGFYLNFSDNSGTTATTLGKDYSGNGNNWTPNNFSVTAGAGNDSMVDTPTNYGTDTGAGGEVRGNYATINPIMTPQFSQTYTNGNLECTGNYAYVNAQSTICASSGKWYAEAVFNVKNSALLTVGAFNKNISNYIGNSGESGTVGYWTDGTKSVNGTSSSYGATYTVNDVIGVAMDITGNSITFYKNGVSQGAISYTFDSSGAWGFLTSGGGSFASGDKVTWNFGQRPFAYTAPSGFKALCTTNLPTPAIGATSVTLASSYMNVATYTGNGSTQTISTVGFTQDVTWIKSRGGTDGTWSHRLYDTVRGATKRILPNLTEAESTQTTELTAFNSNGFSLGSGDGVNQSGTTFVSWNWKAGGAASNNTSGTITSNVSVSTTAGFSVVIWTGNGSNNATIGHGLGTAPKLVITKARDRTQDWPVYTTIFSSSSNAITLNSTSSQFATTAGYISTFGATTLTLTQGSGSFVNLNASANTYVAYCFAEVTGYSKIGTYTGNGNSDGPFVYCGFRPRWLMVKRTDAASNWVIVDTARSPYNYVDKELYPNLFDAETSAGASYAQDILSNGFKVRRASDSSFNANGGTYIFMAFAETPFNYSRAR